MSEAEPPYFNAAATDLLARLRAELHPQDPDVYRDREAAARELLQSVGSAAKDAGYDAEPERGGFVVSLRKSGSVFFTLEDDKLRMFNPGPPQREISLKIQYDGATRRFVGEEIEKEQVPVVSGVMFLNTKRNAVTVVVEAIVEAIRIQHEARKNAR